MADPARLEEMDEHTERDRRLANDAPDKDHLQP
jgi:hypothetical protein